MLKAGSASPADGVGHAMWAELKAHLEQARRLILEEIRHYPPPIAACDQQFNHLLEQRDRIAGELSRLAAVRDDPGRQGTEMQALDDFIAASPGLDDALKERLTAALRRSSGV